MSVAAFQPSPEPIRPGSTNIRPKDSVRISIGHALVDNCSFEQAETAIINHAVADGEASHVITPNAQHIVLIHADARLRQIYRKADLVVPDGVSLLLAAHLFGHRFKERVSGVDLLESLCGRAAASNLNVFFLGGRPDAADLAAVRLRERNPALQVQTYCPPLGFENDPVELNHIDNLIRRARPRILFVALGAPKQEYWIYNHGRKLGVSVCIGVGGSFEMVGGLVGRAPKFVQKLGCEWLYRLYLEPRRMWRRYLIGNSQFLLLVALQFITQIAFGAILGVLKSQRFEWEFLDARSRVEAIDVLSRVAADGTEAG
jgi:N-acetylglucosaminyldiphosphoundecaprenol N-acetyl-beta-D-mannosaminyltransferase